MLCRLLAENLAAHGADVEVLTTCATDHFTWADAAPRGDRRGERRDRPPLPGGSGARQRAVAGAAHAHRPAAAHHAAPTSSSGWPSRSGRRASRTPSRTRAATTGSCHAVPVRDDLLGGGGAARAHRADAVRARRAARVDPGRARDARPRGGCMLNSPGEGELLGAARARCGGAPGERGVRGRRPARRGRRCAACARARGIAPGYVLYAGRREVAKGLPMLFAAYAELGARRPGAPPLALMGSGDLAPPPEIADRVIDLGFVPDEDRDAVYAGAAVLVNPSRLESLGMVVLEAWLAGTPSHRERPARRCCASTAGHRAEASGSRGARAGGGAGAAAGRPRPARGGWPRAGAAYTRDTFSWPAVRDRFAAALEAWS